MNEFASGSTSRRVQGVPPSRLEHRLRPSKKPFQASAVEACAASPSAKPCVLLSASATDSTRPSTVVMSPPSVPVVTSSSSSGISSVAVSALITSRRRSSGASTLSSMRLPFAGTPPPPLTSLLRYPQLSHASDIRITSLKNGISVRYILVVVGAPQAPQWPGISMTSSGAA